MKISTHNLLRLAGLCAVLAGICYVLVGLFHPPNLASSVTSTRWQVVHVLACAVSFFGLLGVTGLYARQAVKSGWLGLAGYLLFSLWLVLIMGFSFVEAFILPRVANATPTFVQAWMGMFTGPKGTFDLGILPTIWTLTAPVYILGGLLVRHRNVASRHPASLGRRTARCRDRDRSNRKPATERVSAESGRAGRGSSGLARVRAVV